MEKNKKPIKGVINGKLLKNNKWTGIKTVVKGLRAEQSFFDKVELVAKAENISKNELIVRVVGEYCDKFFSENRKPTKNELYEIYKRQGGDKPINELTQSQLTMLSVIYYKEKIMGNENVENKR